MSEFKAAGFGTAIERHCLAMDADVISMETSRSQLELLRTFGEYQYPK